MSARNSPACTTPTISPRWNTSRGAALPFSKRRGISYAAWRQAGVGASELKQAGMQPSPGIDRATLRGSPPRSVV